MAVSIEWLKETERAIVTGNEILCRNALTQDRKTTAFGAQQMPDTDQQIKPRQVSCTPGLYIPGHLTVLPLLVGVNRDL
jgi:hypothetical protein